MGNHPGLPGLYGAGMHYDPLISSRAKSLVSWGHDWVVLTSRQEARERRIVGSLKPFRWNPAGNQSRPVEPDQQPEASLAWWVGDHPCEA